MDRSSSTLIGRADALVLYTDGITEAFNQAQEEFGEDRLIQVLRNHRHRCSRELLAAIVDEVRAFSPHEQGDDMTLIVAKCRRPAKAR